MRPFAGKLRLRRLAFIFVLTILCGSSSRLSAQTSPTPPLNDTQIWFDLSASHALNHKSDLNFDGGLRWGRDVSQLVYERLATGVAFRVGKYVTLAPRYTFTDTQPTATTETRENRLGLDAIPEVRAHGWRLSDRNVIERRFRKPFDTTRYRNRLRIDRDVNMQRFPFYLFVSDELYYEWRIDRWTRNRFLTGGGASINPRLSLEAYFVKQREYVTLPHGLQAAGVLLRTRF